jgi:hypothetical protein
VDHWERTIELAPARFVGQRDDVLVLLLGPTGTAKSHLA